MNRIPRPSTRQILFQTMIVCLFCLSLWFFMQTRTEKLELNQAIQTLRYEKTKYDRIKSSVENYTSLRQQIMACRNIRTPLVWEQIEIHLEELGFFDLLHHLRFLHQDIENQYGRDGMFVMETMQMTQQDRLGARTGPVRFLIRGYLLSVCGGETP
ncbi:hypothetical protein [Desulfolithobacter sp.]